MSNKRPTYEELEQQLTEAHQLTAALRGGEVDAIISERDVMLLRLKDTEKSLRRSEENFRRSIENSPLGIRIVTAEGELLYANQAILDIYGYSSLEELRAAPVKQRYTPESYVGHQKRKKMRKRGEYVLSNYEISVVRKDGEIRHLGVFRKEILWNGKTQFQVVYLDITEHKQVEEALRRAEENFRRSLDGSPLGVRIVTIEGETVYTNRAMLNIYGYDSIEELRTTPIKERYTPESHAEFQIRQAKRQQGEYDPFEYEVSIVRKNGEVRRLQVFRKEILWNGKRQFQTIYQDITSHKQIEEEQELLLADLETKNRELEAFAYTISHDLKAPIVSLDGFFSLLEKEFQNQLGKQGQHYLERIRANMAHMKALITSLLELSRIGQVVGAIEEIDVGLLLRDIREAVRPKEAGAEFVVQGSLPTVCADRGRIHQVFADLIDNAVKFRSTERALHIEVGCRQESGFYRFHVADNGIGIPPRYHEQIFAPFRKLHPQIEGIGMGLALVKKIVEHHGGRVWVESPSAEFIPSKAAVIGTGNERAGATFYFTLPIERRVNRSVKVKS